MENYHGAFLQRVKDTECLHQSGRKTAAMHWGGAALECLLKSMIVQYYGLSEWKTEHNHVTHSIENPGHHFHSAVKKIPKLLHRLQSNPALMKMMDRVQQPDGEWVNLRYSHKEPTPDLYKDWYKSYNSLLQWLVKQSTNL